MELQFEELCVMDLYVGRTKDMESSKVDVWNVFRRTDQKLRHNLWFWRFVVACMPRSISSTKQIVKIYTVIYHP
jgi:hypothetical protein